MIKISGHTSDNRKNRFSGSLSFLVLTCGIAGAHSAAGDDYSPSHTVIVVTDKGEVFSGDKSIGTLRSGTVVHYTKENGKWLLSGRYQGWIHRDQVVPLERAVDHFDRLFSSQPKEKVNPEIYQHRGIARSELGDYAGALADYQKALDAGLKTASLFANRALAWKGTGDKTKALADFTEALRISPEHSTALYNRARLLFETEQWNATVVDCNASIKSDPHHADAFNLRGTVYLQTRQFDQAIADFTSAITEHPKYAEAYGNRGFARKQSGRYDDAVTDFERAMELNPALPNPLNDLAWLQATASDEKLRNPEKALELSQKACELTNFKNSEFVETYAAAQAASGRFEDAVKWQTVAIELAPEAKQGPMKARLALFIDNQPFREPAVTAPAVNAQPAPATK